MSLFFYLFSVVYGTAAFLYLLLRVLMGDSLNVIALLNNCMPTVLLPSLFITPIAVMRKHWYLFLWNFLITLFVFYEFGARFIPNSNAECIDTIKILSHNTAQDLSDYDNIIFAIRESEADIVALQEITIQNIRKTQNELSEVYPYQIYGPLQSEKQVGMGILSRFPITKNKNFKLANDGLVYQQRAEIFIDNQSVSVYNIHLTFPWVRQTKDPVFSKLPWLFYDEQIRHEEVENLVKKLKREKNLIILAGDFNFTDQTSDYHKIVELLNDAYRNVGIGLGYTWPANRTPSINIRPAIPWTRIDYVFHSAFVETCVAKVLNETGSDHKPVFVKLSIN